MMPNLAASDEHRGKIISGRNGGAEFHNPSVRASEGNLDGVKEMVIIEAQGD